MYYDKESGNTTFLAGLLVGALVGASVALLTTPQSGPHVRARLVERVRHPMSGGYDEDELDELEEPVRRRGRKRTRR